MLRVPSAGAGFGECTPKAGIELGENGSYFPRPKGELSGCSPNPPQTQLAFPRSSPRNLGNQGMLGPVRGKKTVETRSAAP